MEIPRAAVSVQLGIRLVALRCRASAQTAHFFIMHLIWLDNSQPDETSPCRRAVENQSVLRFDRKASLVDQRDCKYYQFLEGEIADDQCTWQD